MVPTQEHSGTDIRLRIRIPQRSSHTL
jgi:hypothetical protein